MDQDEVEAPSAGSLPIGLDVESHNAWVQRLIDDVEFEPLKGFLERLKE